ncbi:MAG: hypothetical protein K2J71_01895 [Oscillospiraceae bacterium]|nr:hypothetical protein [Oscillospiraceae bacterium]
MHVLMINVPYSGHVNPTIPLTKALVKAGHQVSYINAEPFREKIEKTGAVFIPYVNYPDKITEREKKQICFQSAYDTAMKSDQKFDLLIYEMFFYPGIEIARKKKIPCVRQFAQPAWSEETWKDTSVRFKLTAKLLDMQVMGRKRIADMNLQYHSMADAIIHDKPDLNLVYVPEKFQRNRDSFDADFMFTVPAQEQEHSAVSIPYDCMKYPIVYISLGSTLISRAFYRKCIKAFEQKNFSVILNTGKINPGSLGKIPENIYAYSFVPQIEVLKHTAVFLTHCGMNSINEALCAGVPMVAMPILNDQPENAKQIVNLGLGKRIRLLSGSQEIYHAVCEVYQNKAIKNNVLAMKQTLQQQADWATLIKTIEKLACK